MKNIKNLQEKSLHVLKKVLSFTYKVEVIEYPDWFQFSSKKWRFGFS